MSWTARTLGEIARQAGGEVRTGPFGSQLHKSDYVDDLSATPVVMPKDMVDGRVDPRSIARVDDRVVERLCSHVLRTGDIVLGRRGEIGRRAWTGDVEDGWLCGTGSMRITINGSTEVRPRFLFYYLGLPQTIGWLQGHAVGATMSNLSAGVVQQLPVRYPPTAVQDAVIEVLDAVENLIENNRRRIEILAEVARLLYREWFVHFRFPGHEVVELVDSDFGPVPEAWAITTLGDGARWLSGGTPDTREPAYWGGEVPWITSGSLTSFLLDDSDRTLTQVGVNQGSRMAARHATMFVVRGMSLAKEFRHGVADVPVAFGQDCKALIANPGIEPLFLAFSVSSLATDIQGMVEFAAHGTGKLSTDRLQALIIPHPPEWLQQLFVGAVEPMLELMSSLRRHTRLLREARDLLLPRLVSGDLDVSKFDLDLAAV